MIPEKDGFGSRGSFARWNLCWIFLFFFYIEEVGRLSGSFGCISFSPPDVDGAYCPHE